MKTLVEVVPVEGISIFRGGKAGILVVVRNFLSCKNHDFIFQILLPEINSFERFKTHFVSIGINQSWEREVAVRRESLFLAKVALPIFFGRYL